MSEVQGMRLRKAREAAGYGTAEAAAEAMNIPYGTYAGHENGSRSLARAGDRYARFFRVNSNWLVYGNGPMKPGQVHPVLELFEAIPPEKQPEAMDYLTFMASRSKT